MIKLLITVAATIILMIHTVPVRRMADMAVVTDLTSSDLSGARVQLIVASGAAVLALLEGAHDSEALDGGIGGLQGLIRIPAD